MSIFPETELYGLYDRPVTNAANSGTCIETDPCEVCRRSKAQVRFQVAGLESPIVECEGCGTARFFPSIPLEQITSFYPTEYYGSTGEKFRPSVEMLVRVLAARLAGFITRQVPPGGKILDVGCGRGTLLGALVRQGFEAHGFELSESAAKGRDPKVQLRTGSHLADADYPSQSFDAVIIWHVLEHLSSPRSTVEEAHRILRPGGLLVIAVPNYSSWQSRWAKSEWFHLDLPRHLFHFPIDALKQLMTSSGFECLSSHHFSLRQNPFGWLQSAFNKWGWGSRNELYVVLHGTPPRSAHPISKVQRLALLTAFLIGIPFALGISILEALCRRGGTIHVVARRNEQVSQ